MEGIDDTYRGITTFLGNLQVGIIDATSDDRREAAFQDYVSAALASVTVADSPDVTRSEAARVLRPLFFPDELRKVLVNDGNA